MRPEHVPITYYSVASPQWVDDTCTKIICTVQFGHLPEPAEFVADPDDVMPHGVEIFRRCVAGDFGPLTVAPPERLEGWPRGEPDETHYVGDLKQLGADPKLAKIVTAVNRENDGGSEIGTVTALTSALDKTLVAMLATVGRRPRRPFFSDRINAAFDAGLITQAQRDALDFVRDIRNELDHEVGHALDDAKVAAWCDSLCAQVVPGEGAPSRRLAFIGAASELLMQLRDRHAGLVREAQS